MKCRYSAPPTVEQATQRCTAIVGEQDGGGLECDLAPHCEMWEPVQQELIVPQDDNDD